MPSAAGSVGIAFTRAAQLQPFLKGFERRGGDIDTVLREAGLEHFDLSDNATLMTGNALYRAVQSMSDALGDRYFASRVGKEFAESGPIFVRESYAASHTLAEFLPLAILELDGQLNNIRYSLRISGDLAVVEGVRTFTPSAPIVQADAAVVSIWVTFLRMVVKEEFDASRLLVTAQESYGIEPDVLPKSSFVKRRWNGVQVAFPSEWLRRRLELDWKIPSAPRGEFASERPENSVMNFLERACLDRVGDSAFTLSEFAHMLAVHPKALQRLLARFGRSFEELRDQARRKRAIEILSEDKPRLNEDVAEALGFSSAASFSRAFKRWTGVPPSDFRRNP